MNISAHSTNGVTIVNISGMLNTTNSGQASEEMNAILEKKPACLLLNLEALEFISSSGLRVLLRTAKVMKGQDGKLKVCGAKGVVKEVMDISGFESLLELYESESEALKAFEN